MIGPWGGGHQAWKVRSYLLSCIGAVPWGWGKTDSIGTADTLLQTGLGVKAPISIGHGSIHHSKPQSMTQGRTLCSI